MKQDKCNLCDQGFITKYGYNWNSDGTWGKKEGLLVSFMGKEEILNIFENIEKELKKPIDKLLILSKRIVTLNVVNQEFLGRFMRFLIRARLFNDNKLKKALNKKFFAPIGWGICEKIHLDHRRKSAIFILKNYPLASLSEGAVSGIVQYIYNLAGVNIKREERGKLLKVLVSPSETEDELVKYVLKPVLASELGLLPGNIQYNFCPKCKIPIDFSERYNWILDEGRIVDIKTNKDQLLFTRYALDAIFGLLKRELGREFISKIIFKAEKKYITNLYKDKNEDFERLVSQKDFGMKGWGNLKEIKKTGDIIEVRIDNPFYKEILSGFVAGAYSATKNQEVRTKWQGKNNILLIKIVSK